MSKTSFGKFTHTRISPRLAIAILALAIGAVALWKPEECGYVLSRILSRFAGHTVAKRVEAIAAAKPWIEETAGRMKGELKIMVFKNERLVELQNMGWEAPRIYRMTNASGKLGPKLREGDGQIPEGVYGIEYLNPNSAFHLSLKVSYPNATDRRHAREDGRGDLGGDIMIHGGNATIGCIPIGDDAIEEVFFFAAKAGPKNVSVVIAPYDMRDGRNAAMEQSPLPWYGTLCDEIAAALDE